MHVPTVNKFLHWIAIVGGIPREAVWGIKAASVLGQSILKLVRKEEYKLS